MEQIYSDLLSLGYLGKVKDKQMLSDAFSYGPPNILFFDLATWLSSQLADLCGLENRLTTDVAEEALLENYLGFLVEMSSLLNELRCPMKHLTRGKIEERLLDADDKSQAIKYLIQELRAAKIIVAKKPKEEPALQIELSESKTAKELREMLISLNFSRPPNNITAQKLFTELEKRICSLSEPLLPKDKVGELLFSGSLTEKQWFQLEKLYSEFYEEYKNRRNLELTRLDVTIQSFLWGDRLQSKAQEITDCYKRRISGISLDPAVKLSDVLSATTDLTIIEKTSSASVRKNTKCAVNKVLIGSVPDRGGRPQEQQPPPPEVPSWQRNDSSSRGGMRQSAGGTRHSTGGTRQSAGGTRQSAGGTQPSVGGGRQPGGGMRQPIGEMQQPVDGMQQPLGGGIQLPSGGMQQPAERMQQPAERMQQPAGRMGQPVAGRMRQPAGGLRQPLGVIQYPAGGMQHPGGDMGGMAQPIIGIPHINVGRRGRGNNFRMRGDNYNLRGRGVFQPVYEPGAGGDVPFGVFGFGGYRPAGDNFQQFGIPPPRPNAGPRPRGDRGGRPYRGQGRW